MRGAKAAGIALMLGACTPPAGEARAVFDQLLKHPESRSLGVAVPAGSEDRVFDCYAKKVEEAGVKLSTVSTTLKEFLQEMDLQSLPQNEKNQVTLRLLLAFSSITTCQGGLPAATR